EHAAELCGLCHAHLQIAPPPPHFRPPLPPFPPVHPVHVVPSPPGTPVSMLQNCAGFAVFAFIFEGMNPPPPLLPFPPIPSSLHPPSGSRLPCASPPGTPVSMLQNCAGFAVFAFIFEGMNPPPQPAVAAELNLLGLSPPHAHCSSSSSSSSSSGSGSGSGEKQCEYDTCDFCSFSSCSYPSSSSVCSDSLSISAGSAAADASLCSSVSSRVRRQVAGKIGHANSNSNGSCPVVYSPQCHQQHLLTVLPLSLSLPLAAQIASSSAYHF
ncbi:unnamed protein product, partial [Closterium sp. Naga37s-1]